MPKRKQPVKITSNNQSAPYGPGTIAPATKKKSMLKPKGKRKKA